MMLAKDILVSFLEYTYQADAHLLQHIQRLTPEQLQAAATISHGTAFDLVRHILDSEWSWRLFASGGGCTPKLASAAERDPTQAVKRDPQPGAQC